jgi:hypothetical protein
MMLDLSPGAGIPTGKPRALDLFCCEGGAGEGYARAADAAREALGMPWASRDGCAEAIPPAYTEYIGPSFSGVANESAICFSWSRLIRNGCSGQCKDSGGRTVQCGMKLTGRRRNIA